MILFPNFSNIEEAVEYVRDTFWQSLRESPNFRPNPLPEEYHGLSPGFKLAVVTRYAHDSNIPEMVQVIFYAMVLNDTAELEISCKIDMNCIMSVLHHLDWTIIDTWFWGLQLRLRRAQVARLANPPIDPTASSGPVEDSGLSDAPPASSDEK